MKDKIKEEVLREYNKMDNYNTTNIEDEMFLIGLAIDKTAESIFEEFGKGWAKQYRNDRVDAYGYDEFDKLIEDLKKRWKVSNEIRNK